MDESRELITIVVGGFLENGLTHSWKTVWWKGSERDLKDRPPRKEDEIKLGWVGVD